MEWETLSCPREKYPDHYIKRTAVRHTTQQLTYKHTYLIYFLDYQGVDNYPRTTYQHFEHSLGVGRRLWNNKNVSNIFNNSIKKKIIKEQAFCLVIISTKILNLCLVCNNEFCLILLFAPLYTKLCIRAWVFSSITNCNNVRFRLGIF